MAVYATSCPAMGTLLYGLGRTAVRRRRLFTLAWVVAAIAIFVFAQARGGETSESFDVPGVEAQQALDVLEDRFPSEAGTSAQLVFAADSGAVSEICAAPRTAASPSRTSSTRAPRTRSARRTSTSSKPPRRT